MTTKLLAGVAALAFVAAFTGCASGSASSPAQSSSPATKQATVTDYVSLINDFAPQLLKANNSDASCASDFEGQDCQNALLPVSNDANALINNLTWGTDVTSPYYVGEPPAEVADLVKTTIEQATDVRNEALASSEQTVTALKTLAATLEQWSQYSSATPTPAQ